MMTQPAVPEKLCQHRQSTGCESLIDERFLPIESLNCRAAWQRVFSGTGIDDLGIQLAHGAQAFRFATVAPVQGLPENVLSAGRVIPEVQPVIDLGQGT